MGVTESSSTIVIAAVRWNSVCKDMMIINIAHIRGLALTQM